MTDVTWTDKDGRTVSCASESYARIYGEAARQIKAAARQTRTGRDEEKEKKVDEISNKHDEDEIRKSNEEIVKKQEEDKKTRESLMALSDDELDEEIANLRAELEELKNPKEAKSASTLEKIGADNSDLKITKRHVLKLHSNRDTSGDELIKSLGST